MAIKCQNLFISFLLFRIFDRSVDCFSFQPITYVYKGTSDCPGGEKNPVYWRGNITSNGQNKYLLNGEVIFKEIVNGPLEVIVFSV